MRPLLTRNYVRLYLWIGIIFTVAILLFSIFLSNQFSKYADNQMNLFHKNKLAQTASRTEFILDKLKSYGLHMYDDPVLQEWFSAKRSPITDMELLNTITEYMSTEPFIQRVYLISLLDRRVMDSQEGVIPLDRFADSEIVDKVKKNPPSLLQFFRHEIEGQSHMSLILPSTPAKKNESGYLVLLLDNRAVEEQLLENNENLGSNIFILDESGQVMLGQPTSSEMLTELRRLMDKSESGVLKMDGGRLHVNTAQITAQNWTLYSLTEMKVFRRLTVAFQYKIIGYSLILLIPLLLAAIWNSQRAVQPFRKLAEQLQRKLKAGEDNGQEIFGGGDDYDILKSGIELLSTRMDRLSQSMRSHHNLVKDEFLRQWLLQGRMDNTLRDALVREPELLRYSEIFLVVCKMDDYPSITEKYDFASRQLLKYAMGNIAAELFAEQGGALETVDMAGDHVVFLLGTNQDIPSIKSTLKSIKQQIKTHQRLQVTIAMTGRQRIHDDLRSVYDFALELCLLKFISGEDKTYTEEDYEVYLEMQLPYSELKGLDRLPALIKSGKKDQVAGLLQDLFTQMKALKYSESKIQLTVLLFSLVKEFNSLSSLQDVEGIGIQLDRFTTLDDLHRWLKQELFAVIDQLSNRHNLNRRDKLAEEMVNYIHYHFQDPNLSPEDIAKHISLSVKYARQLFQDMQNQSLSQYLLNFRIEKVRELLVQTAMSVEDIAARSGFLTRSHFFTAFKKATGMTPNQYRQQNTARWGEGS